jgi:hypothetical protein
MRPPSFPRIAGKPPFAFTCLSDQQCGSQPAVCRLRAGDIEQAPCGINPSHERLSTDEAFEHTQRGREVLGRHETQLSRRLVEDRIGACRGGAAGRG